MGTTRFMDKIEMNIEMEAKYYFRVKPRYMAFYMRYLREQEIQIVLTEMSVFCVGPHTNFLAKVNMKNSDRFPKNSWTRLK